MLQLNNESLDRLSAVEKFGNSAGVVIPKNLGTVTDTVLARTLRILRKIYDG